MGTEMRAEGGFTLIELSIVLVIIGLIVGGVLVGRDLIEAAELRAQVTQIEQINTATNTFRTKYDCLPGDCVKADAKFGFTLGSFWNTTLLGNGFIDGPGNELEMWVFFTNLKEAKLISCVPCVAAYDYGGADASWDNTSAPAKIGGKNIVMAYGGDGTSIGYTSYGQNYSKNYLEIGAPAAGGGGNFFPVTPAQAYAMDVKTDDGYPLTGRVVAVSSYLATGWPEPFNTGRLSAVATGAAGNTVCVSTSSTPNSYNTRKNDKLCGIRFDAQF